MRADAAASSALATTRAIPWSYFSCTRTGMSRGNVFSYIVAYAIFVPTVVAVGAQSLRHSFNPSLRSLTPIRMHQYQLIWNYYCLYIACPGCCKYLYVPRIALDSNTFELFPTWNFASTKIKEGQLQNTTPLINYSKLDLLNEKKLPLLLKRMDHDNLLSVITSLQKSGPVDNILQTKTTLPRLTNLNNSVKNVNITTTNIKTSSDKVGFLFNNSFKNGRRTNEDSTAATKSKIQPSMLLKNITDHIMHKNCTESIIDSLLDEATKTTMPTLNNYEIIQLKSSTNESLKSNGFNQTHQSIDQTKSGLLNEIQQSHDPTKSGSINENHQSNDPTKSGSINENHQSNDPTKSGSINETHQSDVPTKSGSINKIHQLNDPTKSGLTNEVHQSNNQTISGLTNETQQSNKSDEQKISSLTNEIQQSNKSNGQTKSGVPNDIQQSNKSNGQTKSGVPNEIQQSNNQTKRHILFRKFRNQLDLVERKFLLSVFKKLNAISPEDRKENGISFLQSGFFLYQLLLSLSITLDRNVAQEIEDFLGLSMPEDDKVEILQRTAKWLPKSSNVLKFRWSSRLVLRRQPADEGGMERAAARVPLQLSRLHGNETAAKLTETLNNMVLSDSGGGMHDTFEEEELAGGVCAAVLGTACVRGAWRAAPTLLNDSLPFRDAPAAPNRTSRFFRLNDIMAYSHLHEWDAEAIEISYATPGLTLLILVPKEPSLRPLVERVASLGLDHVVGFMRPMRLAVTLPLYTLRMTLLLPNKLEDMGMPSLLTNGTNCQPVKLSHAVQRLMFWAEAGRNAFKDDGIEWDPRPELEIVVDRPYLFFVRWHNITIMNGVFAL